MRSSGLLSLAALSFATAVKAATITYDWTATWVWASPDGVGRPVIGINNAWPCPQIDATVGDTVIINFTNNLGNQTSGLHFHGINQIQTPDMDGPSGVTQCPVPPGSSIQYKFVVDIGGTFWYHSHNMGQYPDGLRGVFLIHDPNDPYAGAYDEEVILTVSDWYHNESLSMVRNMLQPSNTRFAPPIPDGMIINEGAGLNVNFTKGKKYRFRMISFAALASAMIHFDSHDINIIMNDGAYLQKEVKYQLRIATAQRYDFIIECIDRDNDNYPFLISLDVNRDWTNPDLGPLQWPHNYTGYLIMDYDKPNTKKDVVQKWKPADDSHFKPYDNETILGGNNTNYDTLIKVDFKFCQDVNGYPRACFNNLTYIDQKVPALYSAATTGEDNTNPVVYGQINPFIVNFGDVVQIVVNNQDAATHPFHLHGHHFQVLDRPKTGTGDWPARDTNYNQKPPKRDTVTVMAHSFAVLRFTADNPGTWLFHCHIEWHVEMGLTATIIEAPDRLRNFTFPQDQLDACNKMGIPVSGNAAGNTQDYTDTTGMVTVPPTIYNGAMYAGSSSKAKRSNGLRSRIASGMGSFFF
ncbi:putative iron transport multicopper oxidase FET3 [Triangularia verruculosa]|uniref:Iron transport multicopper oxidase FET3 n=1 Tax=Triangularia verruculosa TaxID=2587418 RepID=A0AAN7AX27_9PEZI|nr:putative iron transport multicopper oxidase FET3 [Triangularia verruculosa]